MVLFLRSTLILLVLHRVYGDPSCYVTNFEIKCTTLSEDDLHNNLSESISNENVVDLTIVDSKLREIDNTTFTNFRNVETLRLENTQTYFIENEAFADLKVLKKLFIVDNHLTEFRSDQFSPDGNNSLVWLNISNNKIDDLSEFDMSNFPSLIVLNISSNRLSFLPLPILKILEEKKDLYIIIDDNPWDCSHPEWVETIRSSSLYTEAFCSSTNISLEANLRMPFQNISVPEWFDIDLTENMEKTTTANYTEDNLSFYKCKAKLCFTHCIFWFIGAVWVGVILGNICKLKRLLFCQPNRTVEKGTQYDQIDLKPKLPHEASGYQKIETKTFNV